MCSEDIGFVIVKAITIACQSRFAEDFLSLDDLRVGCPRTRTRIIFVCFFVHGADDNCFGNSVTRHSVDGLEFTSTTYKPREYVNTASRISPPRKSSWESQPQSWVPCRLVTTSGHRRSSMKMCCVQLLHCICYEHRLMQNTSTLGDDSAHGSKASQPRTLRTSTRTVNRREPSGKPSKRCASASVIDFCLIGINTRTFQPGLRDTIVYVNRLGLSCQSIFNQVIASN